MRVQAEFSKQGNSAMFWLDHFKAMYPHFNTKKNKDMTQYHLDADIKYTTRKNPPKIEFERAIYESLGGYSSSFKFHMSNLRIGKSAKCHTCDGTGKSYYPRDFHQMENI